MNAENIPIRQRPLGRCKGRCARPCRPAGLSLQHARRGRPHHQHRRRQYVRKITEQDPVSGKNVEVLWVKGSGGDLRTSKRENFSSLYQNKAAANCKVFTRRRDERGPKTAGRRPHGGDVSPTAPSISTRAPRPLTRRCTPSSPASMWIIPIRTPPSPSPPSKNSDRLTREIYGGRCDPYPLAAPRLRTGPDAAGHRPAEPECPRRDPGPAWPDQLGRRRQRVLLSVVGTDRKGRRLHRKPTTRASRHSAARSIEAWKKPNAAASSPRFALAARPGVAAAALYRHHSGRREDFALRQQPRRAPAGGARHELPRPFPADQDQAALRRLGPTDRGRGRAASRSWRTGWSSTARITPPITRLQASQLAGHARPEPDGHSHSRPGHDRVGQGQKRVARDGGVLQLRGGSDARGGGH